MSGTRKDLKSHKGFLHNGRFDKPKRKLRPYLLDANIETGKKGRSLVWIDNDISSENSTWMSMKQIKRIRKQHRKERDLEKSVARAKLKRDLKRLLDNNG